MALGPGTRVGPYEIVSLLGVGGMGEVYRARDTRLQRDVAIKVLPDHFAADPERLARFEREAQVLASLNHPNIAAIYGLEEGSDVGAGFNRPIRALILELVEGETLADRISRGPIPLDEALPIAKQIVEALEAAHEQGIIHRDLKPANIKITPAGVVKVLDFGLAKLAESAGRGQPAAGSAHLSMSPTITSPALMTGAGVLLGTAAYMAPEQARGHAVDKRGDIWAFGCVLFEMLTGARAFPGDDVTDTIAAVVRAEPRWSALPQGTPAGIRRLLRRALAKNRGQRLPDIAVARLDIDDALTGPLEGEQPSVPHASDTGRWFHSIRFAWSTVAALVLVASASVAFLAIRPRDVDPSALRATILPPRDTRIGGASNDRLLALSPDGRRIVFVASSAGGHRQLWVRRLDSLDAQPLPGTDDGQTPFWSPDSRWVAFFDPRGLKKIDLAGGPPVTVSTKSAGTTGGGGTWNRDGLILFSDTATLWSVPAAGGTPSLVMKSDGTAPYQFPYFLPDGQHFLYRGAEYRTYLGDLGSKQGSLLGAGGNAQYADGNLLFLRDGTLMAQPFDVARLQLTGEAVPVAERLAMGTTLGGVFSVSAAGVLVYQAGSGFGGFNLSWFDRSGKSLAMAADPGDYQNLSLAADERRLAVSMTAGNPPNRDIWVIDLARGVRTRITFQPGTDSVPAWSPDGARIAFNAQPPGGAWGLYQKNSNGSGTEEALMKLDGAGAATDWSRDGRFIIYEILSAKMGSDLWIVPTFGDRKPIPFQQTPFNEDHGAFSPDVRWIAYTSNESGVQQVYIQPFPPTGDKYAISRSGGSQPMWRSDGKELFFLAPDSTLMSVRIDTTRGFEAGIPERLFSTGIINADATRRQYAVSKDGKRFLVRVPPEDAASEPLNLVVNWPAALRK